MSLDLESIQEMWKKDSDIDRDNLHEESLKIPSLHAKYFELYNTIFLLRKKAEQQRKNIRHERYEYYSGKADPDVYIQNPFPKKVRDKDTQQMKDKTTWHKVVTFDPNLAKTIKDYVNKGTLLYLEGQIDVSQYIDSSGNKKFNTSILIPRYSGIMKMLGGKQGSKTDNTIEEINDDALPDDPIPF